MDTETYLEQLAGNLQHYGVEAIQIGEIIAEVESHLAESGEDAVEAFGPPDAYAEHRAASVERGAAPDDVWQRRTFRATAFDEMRILAAAGQDGWELTDVAAFALPCRRPWDPCTVRRWAYRRRVGINRDALVTEMRAAGWEPCGLWLPFHYFKRPLAAATVLDELAQQG